MPKTIKEIMSEFDNWCFNNKTHLGRDCDRGEIKNQLKSSLYSLLDEVERQIGTFTPTCGYESEEEKGFQKGIQAEQSLIKGYLSDLRKELK